MNTGTLAPRALMLSGVLALAGGAGAWMNGTFTAPPLPRPGGPAWAQRRDVAGVENFGEVVAGRLYRGAQPGSEGYAALRALGVRTVVNLRELHDESDAVRAAGMEPVAIPLQADVRGSRPPGSAEIERFLAVVTDPARQPVFFHCAQGRDRTGTMCALYRMEVEGWEAADAWREMQGFGFNRVWRALAEFVQAYRPAGRWRR